MNTKLTALAVLLASIGTAAAAADAAGPGRTRAQVQGELMAALARGEHLSSGEAQYERQQAPISSTRSRAEVRDTLLRALEAGDRPSAGEMSYQPPVRYGVERSRAEVADELRALLQGGGSLPRGEAG